jgi:hypothetical protein
VLRGDRLGPTHGAVGGDLGDSSEELLPLVKRGADRRHRLGVASGIAPVSKWVCDACKVSRLCFFSRLGEELVTCEKIAKIGERHLVKMGDLDGVGWSVGVSWY